MTEHDKTLEEKESTDSSSKSISSLTPYSSTYLPIKPPTILDSLPENNADVVRFASYNVCASFFDGRDKSEKGLHKWEVRAKFCTELIAKAGADIFFLQELSPEQASQLSKAFSKTHSSLFLSQTPSDVPAGVIANGSQVGEWVGKNVGTAIVGTFVRHNWTIKEKSCFWLNDNPDEVPTATDRGETDKGFGNMNTYRAVLSLKIESENTAPCYVFNSHYPLSGGNKTRQKCAELEMSKIHEIAGKNTWVSSGDRNFMITPEDNEHVNRKIAYLELAKHGYDAMETPFHFGTKAT